jgi:hypothetical protein
MGIGGAVLYSVAFMAARGLSRVVMLAAQLLRWLARLLLEGAALHGASLASGQLFNVPLWEARKRPRTSAGTR